MINIKNIIKVLMMAMFISSFSSDAFCARIDMDAYGSGRSDGVPRENVQVFKNTSPKSSPTSNTQQDASFCGSDKGVFSELVMTGQKIFNRLRDLIYVTAGFGIIAIAVGGFFGSLNWKWLGAIVVSLIVIACAGEVIVLLTGCEQYGTSLITNTLTEPAAEQKIK